MRPAYAPPQEALNIIYHDEALVIVSKPSGLLSVPGREFSDCMAARVQAQFPDALVTHRLDMDTSGLMIFARGKDAQRNVSRQFETRTVKKIYHALVDGVMSEQSGVVDLPLICDWPNRPLQKVCYEHGKPAQTEWRVVRQDEDKAFVELKPLTGRSHQLRVHMKEIGHPILGDVFYAPPEAQKASPRLALHASTVELTHPLRGEVCVFEDAAVWQNTI